MTINYIKGDATKPQGKTGVTKIIPHLVNDQGRWGKGFVIAVGKAFPQAEREYRNLKDYELGMAQIVDCGNDIFVVNMVAQHGIRWAKDGSKRGCPPIRYDALYESMKKVCNFLLTKRSAEIHAPKFGSDLAGGSWTVVEALIEKLWVPHADVYVYEYDPDDGKTAADPGTNGDKTDAADDIFDL